MINRILVEKQIQYVDPEQIDEAEYVLCKTRVSFEISTHFTRVSKPEDPDWDQVFYFIKRDALFDRLERR